MNTSIVDQIALGNEIELTFADLSQNEWDLIAFDLDDTLAPSKSALPPQMAEALRALLDQTRVAVISGGALPQFQSQLLSGLHASDTQLANLSLLPTCGTRYMHFEDGKLVELYAHDLSAEDRRGAMETLEAIARAQGIWEEETWGPILEDRGSQITYSALGQEAPLAAKRAWDPDGEKKNRLAMEASRLLPHLEVRSGGSTSVDITEKGIDKAYGMLKLQEMTGIEKSRTLFIGDRLDPAGNDYPVKAAIWPTFDVSGWEQTVTVINEIVRSKTQY